MKNVYVVHLYDIEIIIYNNKLYMLYQNITIGINSLSMYLFLGNLLLLMNYLQLKKYPMVVTCVMRIYLELALTIYF